MHLSPAILEYIGAVGLFYLVWFAAGWPVARWRVAAEWDPEFRPHPLLLRMVPALSIGHAGLPHFFFLVTSEWAYSISVFSGSGYVPLMHAALMFLLPYGTGEAIAARRAARLERSLAGDSIAAHMAVSERIFRARMAPALLIFTTVLWGTVGGVGGLGGAMVAGAIGGLLGTSAQMIRLYGRYEPAGRKEARMEFPDLPLKHEIVTVLKKGLTPSLSERRIVVQPPRSRPDPFKVRLMYQDQGWSYKRQLVVPVAVLQSLDPADYTAALARNLAFARISGLEGTHRRNATVAAGCLAFPVLGISLLLAQGLTFFFPNWSSAVLLIAVLLFLLLFPRALNAMGLQDVGRDSYRDAFLNWHDADPDADRTVEDFVAALARVEATIEFIACPEVTLHRLQRDRALMDFLDHCGPDTKSAALRAAREALVAPMLQADGS